MMKIPFNLYLLSLILLFACNGEKETATGDATAEASGNYLEETQEERDARMEWWKEARFGMFIHWGLYAVPAGEWNGQRTKGIGEWIMDHLNIPITEYEKFAQEFNPVNYDPEEWVAIAKNAGMKYIVITSKHHDGFALWDSKVTEWDVVDATPYGKDLLRQLAEACRAQGIKLCFYHSIMDWHHPDAQAIHEPDYNQGRESTKVNPNFERYVENYLKPQLKELLTNYGDIGVLWFDGEWIPDYTSEMGKDIYQFVRNIQPDIIINNRVDKGRKGMEGLNREGQFAGDFGTPEQEIPATGMEGVDWESCMTMNDTWGYKSADDNWKSGQVLIRNLVDIASKGGNFLLNVGPTEKGEIPAPSVARLEKMGEWMQVNGEAIYDTEASPFPDLEWGRCTQKKSPEGDVLFLHVFDWPEDGQLKIPLLDGQAERATLLADQQELTLEQEDDHWRIGLPAASPDPICTVIKLELKHVAH